MDNRPLKIALLQLYSNGDCLFATIIARQIKSDYPNSILTWFVSDHCKGMLENNPDIDHIISLDAKGTKGIKTWYEANSLLKKKVESKEYDLLFSSQIIDENERYFCGSIRSSILKTYRQEITVPKTPFLYLTSQEINTVKEFIESNNILKYKNRVLFECSPLSGQVKINTNIATEIANNVLMDLNDTCFILTSPHNVSSNNSDIYDASSLTLRENAELINYCTHLIGCSSGISWLSISSWIKIKCLPTLQLLDNKAFYFNSMVRDLKYQNENYSKIIETKLDFGNINDLVRLFIENFDEAKIRHHIAFNDRSSTVYSLSRRFILTGKTGCAFEVLKNNFKTNLSNFYYYYIVLKLVLLFPFLIVYRSFFLIQGKRNQIDFY